jgi:hypothetical protein
MSRSLIIFDYDDTLCPSTEINRLIRAASSTSSDPSSLSLNVFDNILKTIDSNKSYFSSLVTIVHELLKICSTNPEYELMIISNGETDWVSGTSRVLFGIDFTKEYSFVSSREYCFNDVSISHLWKPRTIRSILSKKPTYSSIVGVGDSMYDRQMIVTLNVNRSKTFLKSVKLNELPTVDLMVRQLTALTTAITHIVDAVHDMDVQLTLLPLCEPPPPGTFVFPTVTSKVVPVTNSDVGSVTSEVKLQLPKPCVTDPTAELLDESNKLPTDSTPDTRSTRSLSEGDGEGESKYDEFSDDESDAESTTDYDNKSKHSYASTDSYDTLAELGIRLGDDFSQEVAKVQEMTSWISA